MLEGIGEYLDEIIMFGIPALTFIGIAGYGCWRHVRNNNPSQIQDDYYRSLREHRRKNGTDK
ncbi:MAG: hypothetical protein V3V26_00700 [Candidatus Aenigmarchaeota archaeon]